MHGPHFKLNLTDLSSQSIDSKTMSNCQLLKPGIGSEYLGEVDTTNSVSGFLYLPVYFLKKILEVNLL